MELQKNQTTGLDDMFTKPDPSKVNGLRPGSYDKLNDKGYVPVETIIENGDVIMGRITPIQPVGNSNKTFKDSSEIYKSHVSGVVNSVMTDIFNTDGYEIRKMLVRSERIPNIGDKFSSRMGQKGTIGITCKQSDMPFTSKGIVPDICMNPCAIPSRMTIGQLIEGIVGKVAAIEGTLADGTPFSKIDIESVKNKLEELGEDRNGCDYLYNGMTGLRMKTKIFITPIAYSRLKHQVEDKMHSRSDFGPKTLLTRQPPDGRTREGGLRLGEMERDSLLAHGAMKFLKEKTVESSDAYTTFICDRCGLFAQRLYKKGNQSHSTAKDVWFCQVCNNYTEISKIMIPYAFKLLIQELMSMNIVARIRV